jgi:hypothetical protein
MTAYARYPLETGTRVPVALRWSYPRKNTARGKGCEGHVYYVSVYKSSRIWRRRGWGPLQWSWQRPSSSLGECGRGPFKTLLEAMQSAEQAEINRLWLHRGRHVRMSLDCLTIPTLPKGF